MPPYLQPIVISEEGRSFHTATHRGRQAHAMSCLKSSRWFLSAALVLILVCAQLGNASDLLPFEKHNDGDGIVKVSFTSSPEIERADLYYRNELDSGTALRAILILAPGRNGNGRKFLTEISWREFARDNHLILCGVSFSSKKTFVEKSYSNAHSGSGAMLLEAVDYIAKEHGSPSLPVLMYGFSAGARFTASFVESHSDRILAWCGYSVGRWERAQETAFTPPGIVASGEWDAGCYHASLLYFQQGRKLGKPWNWLSLKETGHQRSKELDAYVRSFFEAMLDNEKEERSDGKFFDIDTKKQLSTEEMEEWPIFATWVPEGELGDQWLKLHHP